MGKKIKEPKTTLEWASEYAKRGWAVFPCHRVNLDGTCTCHKGAECDRPGKHTIYSLEPESFKDASIDHLKLKEWFSKDDVYNIGLRTGNNPQGSLIVIDIDEGDGKSGGKTLELLETKYGRLPFTLVQRTGSGGRHLVYWGKPGIHIKSTKNILRAEAGLPDRDAEGRKTQSHIDVRADGGYIVSVRRTHLEAPGDGC
ncbi:MAG: bifunctional DNA primase/polymerase [Candidatus Hydrogenedentes bacterium]|nr:bifunctional DNA primase/polymerase [Candidatus Hydrogenedentota bacterium]